MEAKNIAYIAKMFTITVTGLIVACSGDLSKLGAGISVAGSPAVSPSAATGSTTIAPVTNTATPSATASVEPVKNTATPTPIPPATRSINLTAPNGTIVYPGQRPHAQTDINRYEFVNDAAEDAWTLYVRCSNDTKPGTYPINADSPRLFDIYCPEAVESLVGEKINLAAWLQGKKYHQSSEIAKLSYTVSARPTPSPTATPTATPAPTPTPTATPAPTPAPTPTPTATPTPAPTPTATPTPTPSPTPAPTDTPTPTPTPSPTPTQGTAIN
ncbi:hypothetical protein HY620_02925 [Candidatus Uhrbacteria bacterium]|nr:hypothetical protein [Candidatus Uhrbacteria bacterium]